MASQVDFTKDVLVDLATILVAYYLDYISGVQSNIVTQHFQKEGILPNPKIYTKSILIKNITTDWLMNQAKGTIPKTAINKPLLAQASNGDFSLLIDRYKEILLTHIDSQLGIAGMTGYGVKISLTKITFGDAHFLKEKYEEESTRKECFRQNLLASINYNTMSSDE